MKKACTILLILFLSFAFTACTGETIVYNNDYDLSYGVENNIDKEVTFTVSSYNIQGGKLNENKVEKIRELLINNSVKIVGLQEFDQLSKRTDKKDFMSSFIKAPIADGFFAPTNTILMKATFGNASLSFDKIDESFSFLLPYPYKKENGNVEKRVVSRILTKIDGVQVAFYNTHLSFENILLDNNKSLRQSQIKYIISLMNSDPSKYKILTGDFNVESFAEYMPFIDSGYKMINNEENNFMTYRDKATFKGIDNIIFTSNLHLNNCKMIDSDLSDHNPLIASFKTIV